MILSATGKLIPLTDEMILEMKKQDVNEENMEAENKENLVNSLKKYKKIKINNTSQTNFCTIFIQQLKKINQNVLLSNV